MKKAGKQFDPVTYEGASHAFMRPGDSKQANTTARNQAWERWRKLLKGM
jgi:carboxymethylenebutenolidase